MNKIYEIKFKEGIDFSSRSEIITRLGSFSLFNNIYYVCTENIDDILEHVSNYKEIDKTNCQDIPNKFCKEWCLKTISDNQVLEFESKNQEYLKGVDDRLNFLLKLQEDGMLDEYIENLNKKGGGAIEPKKTDDQHNQTC
jgi:hypothetical protein